MRVRNGKREREKKQSRFACSFGLCLISFHFDLIFRLHLSSPAFMPVVEINTPLDALINGYNINAHTLASIHLFLSSILALERLLSLSFWLASSFIRFIVNVFMTQENVLLFFDRVKCTSLSELKEQEK